MENIVCLLSSAHGQYIPQAFIKAYTPEKWGVTDDEAEILRAGPEHPDYWDAWDDVLHCAWHTAEDGRTFALYQDGDLFAVAVDALTDEEYREFFGEDRH